MGDAFHQVSQDTCCKSWVGGTFGIYNGKSNCNLYKGVESVEKYGAFVCVFYIFIVGI